MTRLLLLGLLLAAAPLAAQPVSVPGTRVALDPPDGFRTADQFDGFQHDVWSAALLVAEVPGAAFDELATGFTEEALAGQGVSADTLSRITLDGVPALYVVGTQQRGLAQVDKWVIVVGDSLGVVIVNGVAPLGSAPEIRAAMRRAVRSVTWTDDSPDLFGGLPFSLPLPTDLPDRNRVGPSVILSDGFGGDQPDGSPLFIVSVGSGQFANLRDDARGRLAEHLVFDDDALSVQPVTIDGRSGIRLTAVGVDAQSGVPSAGSLVVLPGVPTAAGYVVTIGLAGTSFGDAWLDRFGEIEASIRWAE